MICPRCGSTAIQSRRLEMSAHEGAEVLSCVICGEIIRHEPVSSPARKNTADQYAPNRNRVKGVGCKVKGCVRAFYSKGFCRVHYYKHRAYLKKLEKLRSDYSEVI